MQNHKDNHEEGLCPECGCNITEAREEEKKEQHFEARYEKELVLIRKRAKRERMLKGAIVLMLFPLLFLVFAESHWAYIGDTNYLTPIVIVYGLIGAWFGTMWKGRSREEKKLWKNFNSPELTGQ